MDSTGQYWRPLWNILEGEVARLVLVNPADVKALAGRKTDRIDSQRVASYLENRDVHGSFVPPREIRELRDLTRSRIHLLGEVNRVQNASRRCARQTIKVSSVASDLFGVSGRKMLAAIGEGRRDAGWMAAYACGTLRNKKKELDRALEGSFGEHQRWLLGEGPDTELPPAVAVLNPNRPDCSYPNKNLCGAGVTFKLVQAMLSRSALTPERQAALGHLSSLGAQIERVQREIERRMQP